MLKSGATLSQTTAAITQSMGIEHTVAPMSDSPVRTIVHSDQGDLAFQHYFVREGCGPKVSGFSFDGIANAELNPLIREWLADCDGVIICPSNPFVSVAPLLHLDGFGEALKSLMHELNMPATALAVADHYQGLIDGFVVDQTDAALVEQFNVPTISTPSVMVTLQDRIDLARTCVSFLASLSSN